MQPDPEYLRRHYAQLSDEGLLDIDRADLVDVAQQLYDQELRRRQLTPDEANPQVDDSDDPPDQNVEPTYHPLSDEVPPDWHDDAAEVFSSTFHPGTAPAPEIDTARDVLDAAGIPCYLDTIEEEEGTSRCRVMVPGKFNFRAASLLDKEIFNAEFEALWKAHLEALSVEDLRAMNPREAFCGLFDRIERVTRAYNEELARRKTA